MISRDSLEINAFCAGELQTNSYLVVKNTSAFLVDPGGAWKKISATIQKKSLTLDFIINTHCHIDHIQDDEKFEVPIYIHSLDKNGLYDPSQNLSIYFGYEFILPEKIPVISFPETFSLDFHGTILEIIHTPGHTPGGVCIKVEDTLLSGDTLFFRSIGRTDLPSGNHDLLIEAIRKKIFVLSPQLRILPGHGPETTLHDEIRNNPFFI